MLKNTRMQSGISLEEVSKDLNIPVIDLTQIEEGNIGSFKDIFVLKKYLCDYSKYLGLNQTEVMDEFNEFMFEKTSKLPMEEISKAVKNIQKEELQEDRVASPYTREVPLKSNKQLVLALIIVSVLVVLAVLWSIKSIAK